MAITLDTTLSRNKDICYVAVNTEEAVIFDAAAGECYGLNSVAARVWELLEQPMNVMQISARICEEFEVDLETCQNAVLGFATEIIDDGIVCATETLA